MALTSFLKNIFSSETESAENTTSGGNGPRFEHLSGRQFRKEFESTPGAVLLDVRTSAEFKSGTIRGAVNLDIMSPAFQRNIAQMDKSKTYFVFCRSGNRSGQACKIMHKAGFDVRNLTGGIGEW